MIATLALAFLAPAPAVQGAEMIDGIVAVVDDTVIMYSDVIRKMRDLGVERIDGMSIRQTLQVMVEDAVVAGVYRRMGLPPVDERTAQQVSRDMNVDIVSARNFIMKSNIMDLMVKSRVVITESMIREYYDSRPDYRGVPALHLKQILVGEDDGRAGRIMDEIVSGTPFDDVARRSSDLLVNGSCDIGWVALDHLAPEVRAALEGASPGDVRGPVRLDGKTLIYQLVERGTSGGRRLEDVREEIVETLREKHRNEAFRHWLDMTLAEHYIGIFL